MQYHDWLDYDAIYAEQERRSSEYHKTKRWLARLDSGKIVFNSVVYERYEYRDVTAERHALNPLFEYESVPNSRISEKDYFTKKLRGEVQ